MNPLTVATVQFHHQPSAKERNLASMGTFVADAATQGADLIVFPEMCVTGYWHVRHLDRHHIESLAESVLDGESIAELRRLAHDHSIWVGAGLIEHSADDRLFNTYVVVDPDGNVTAHRKLHCFISEHMSSGDHYTVFDGPHGTTLGILICWDNNLIENTRATALLGAEILLAPHQTGGCNSRSPDAMGLIDPQLWLSRLDDPDTIRAEFQGPKGREWLMRWLPARAHDNGIFVVFANGVGVDDDEVRTGNAMILDPYGKVIVESDHIDSDMIVAALDPDRLGLPRLAVTGWFRQRVLSEGS